MNKYRVLLIIIALFLIGDIGYFAYHNLEKTKNTAPVKEAVVKVAPITISAPVQSTSNSVAAPAPTSLPNSINLSVPFTVQAPFAVWDNLHENTCEEASLIMVEHMLNNTQISSPDQADQEMIAMVNWETANGYGQSITLEQLNQVAKDYSGISNGQVVTITSNDQIKQEIAAGHPVIVGMAGRLLPNPYYSNGGPNYHMLVVIGYDQTGFITNDPGTRQGKDFHYDYQPFYTAIHNWDPNNILNGQKAYLVFK